jgi:hypothetical protein
MGMDRFLERGTREGALEVTLPDGRRRRFGDGTGPDQPCG